MRRLSLPVVSAKTLWPRRSTILVAFCSVLCPLTATIAQPPFERGRGFDPTFILRRMDRNGNGMIEPDEMEGRGGDFLKRFLGDGITRVRRPLRIESLAEAIRRRMESGRMGSSSSSSRFSQGGGSIPEDEPLVPGFEVGEEPQPVLGFGVSDEKFDVKVTEEDLREAERTLRRYDANRDGILDAKEIARGRWRDPPTATDRNRDGKLSKSELALRYALRRKARESGDAGSSSSGRSSSRDSRDRGGFSRFGRSSRGGFFGGSSGDRMAMITDSILRRYDTNRNGVLEKSEWGSFRTDPSAADTNRDNKITKEELSKWMADRMSGRSRGDRDRGRSGSGQSGSGSDSGGSDLVFTNSTRRSYRRAAPTDAVPGDLPAWFGRQDANGDGQVSMAEYSRSWSKAVASEFATFDRNGDGVITVAECQAAVENGAVAGLVGEAGEGTESSSSASSADSPATKSPRFLKYAVAQIKKYDTNKDGVLEESEWTKMKFDYSHADVNKDGKITPAELADAFGKR